MSYTKNELALLDLIGNVNKIFYYVGEDGDLIDAFDVKQLDKAVASFKQSIELGDSQAQDYEYKPILYKLQAFWLNNVKPEHMNEDIVEEFLRTMPVESVMFAMNYKKRPDNKKHKLSSKEGFEIINKVDYSYKDEIDNDIRIKEMSLDHSDEDTA